MRAFEFECDVGSFRDIDCLRRKSTLCSSEQFESDDRLLRKWKSIPSFDRASCGKKRSYPDVAHIDWTGGFCVGEEARGFFGGFPRSAAKSCPPKARRQAGCRSSTCSAPTFPPDHYHQESWIGDFATAVNGEVLSDRPLFRDRIYRDDGTWVPGVYIYGTEEFKAAYEEAQLTGLLFEPFWPLDERTKYPWHGSVTTRRRRNAAS